MEAQNQIKIINNTLKNIQFNKTTILVGDNGSGKSVIRKYLELGIENYTDNNNAKTKTISMQTRIEDPSGFGIMKDAPWEPTSIHTYDLICQLFKSSFDEEKDFVPNYFIIDELEIGMSRESQLAVCNWLKEKIPIINEKSYGLLIITHSEFVVEQLKDLCEFIDLNNHNRTADEWINREVIPTDFEKLSEDTQELFTELLPKNK